MTAQFPQPCIAVAPMLDVTDRHCRYFLRLLSASVRLYTEMIVAAAVLHGDRRALLAFDASEHPLAVQLGGREPAELAEAARIAADCGYDEINLNVGCPSERVSGGGFGACLMLEPSRVARCVEAMSRAVSIPVSVKTRVGVDECDSYDFLAAFIATVAQAGCGSFIVHARKAILHGLSPRQNLAVPPLQHALVHRLKADFPRLTIMINGGISTLEEISGQLQKVDGVMIGRKAADDPYFLAGIQRRFFPAAGEPPSRAAVVHSMCDYSRRELSRGARLHHITRHMLGLYRGVPGARRWRRFLSTQAVSAQAPAELLLQSLSVLEAEHPPRPDELRDIQVGNIGLNRVQEAS